MIRIFILLIILFSSPTYAFLPVTTDARIKTLVYSPTEVFKLKFHHNYQAYIEFPRNEKFEIISLGDPFAWDIKNVGQRLFIKPKQAGVLTNMTIITNLRPYHFEITSSTKPLSTIDAELVYVAKFFYPETAYDFMQTVKIKKPLKEYDIKPMNESGVMPNQQSPQMPNKEMPVPPIMTPKPEQNSTLPQTQNMANSQMTKQVVEQAPQAGSQMAYNYSYSMVGPDSSITPSKIFDDGINTYFKFSNNILPDIYYVNQDGSETPAKYTVNDGIVMVKNTSWQFSLRDSQNVICIFNEAKLNYSR